MAKPVSEEELQLKKRARRRLIGAVALVAGVAAVLPMVLDSEPKPTSQEINIQIPSPDAKGGFVPKAVPVVPPAVKSAGETKSDSKAPSPKPEAAVVPAAPVTQPESPAAKAVVEKAIEKPPEKIAEKASPKITKPIEKADKAEKVEKTAKAEKVEKVEKAAAPKAGPGTFFIQVIALAEPEKAKAVQQKIIDAGVRSYTEVVVAGSGKVTRVRAGPFASREEAERARAQLATVGLEGKIAGQ